MDNNTDAPVGSENCLSEVHEEEEEKKALEIVRETSVLLHAYSEPNEKSEGVSLRESSESVYTDDDYLSIIAQQTSRSRYVDKTLTPHKVKQLSSHDLWTANTSFSKHAQQDTTQANDSLHAFQSSESDAVPEVSASYYARTNLEKEFLEQGKKFCSTCGVRVDTHVSYNYETCPWMTAFMCCILFPFLVIFAWLPFLLSQHFYEKTVICARCGTTLDSNKSL